MGAGGCREELEEYIRTLGRLWVGGFFLTCIRSFILEDYNVLLVQDLPYSPVLKQRYRYLVTEVYPDDGVLSHLEFRDCAFNAGVHLELPNDSYQG